MTVAAAAVAAAAAAAAVAATATVISVRLFTNANKQLNVIINVLLNKYTGAGARTVKVRSEVSAFLEPKGSVF